MSDMIRMSIDVPSSLHKLAKMTAAYRDQSIREFVIEQIKKGIARKAPAPKKSAAKGKKPNRLTRETIEKSMRGEDVFAYKSYADFLDEMGRE